MQKHTYTKELAPLNTGSVTRPARFDLRQSVEVHARTHKAFQKVREFTKMPSDCSYADVWEKKILLAIEHMNWHLENSPTCVKQFILSLFDALPKDDYVRVQYARLKDRFEPKKEVLA